MVNWAQLGTDFQHKYEGTYCRYSSEAIDKEVFYVAEVRPQEALPPEIDLHNERLGTLYLKYTTDMELSFEFPVAGYFQHNDEALRFVRRYERQWKKGICPATARIEFPYEQLSHNWQAPMDDETIAASFLPRSICSLSTAITQLKSGTYFSVALDLKFAVGLGNNKTEDVLWYESEPIATIVQKTINLFEPKLEQEIVDFLTSIGEHGNYSVQIV